MSANGGEKLKARRDARCRRAASSIESDSNSASDFTRSLLLDSQPEILRKMYSFLALKEALVLRRTHRNDIFPIQLCHEQRCVGKARVSNGCD
jgi:hypothetical protein